LTGILCQTGCKENTLINSKVSPSNNAVNVLSYTLPVITHTYLDDSTVTSTNLGGIPIYQAIGAISDPFFGNITASTFFQVIPTDFTPAIYVGDSIDSAVLVLPYSGFTYGDTSSLSITQTYQVFYMADTLGLNSNYFSFSNKPVDLAQPLSDPTTITVNALQDSFNTLYVLPNDYPAMRIRLKLPALMSHLIPALNILTTSTNPVQDFLNSFTGICVRVANTNQTANALPYFELDGATIYSEAAILVYYHPVGYPTDTLAPEAYYFNTSACAHFNSITRTFSRAPVNNLIHSTLPNDSIVALSNQPGESIDVLIPGIKSKLAVAIGTGVINKAELQFALLPSYYTAGNLTDTLRTPENLSPLGIGNGVYPAGVGAGLAYELADRYPLTSLTPLTVMDGYLHAPPNSPTSVPLFTIDIPREVIASIAAGNDTLHLHISGTSDYYGAFHLVAGGGNNSDSLYRAKFVVSYSKLKNP
jgi:hypothetical protein